MPLQHQSCTHDEGSALPYHLDLARSERTTPAQAATLLARCHEAFSEPAHRPVRLAISEQLSRLAQRLNDPKLVMRGCTYQIRAALEHGDLESVDAALATLERTCEHARVQITGKKVEIYTTPFKSIALYSSENAGGFLDFNAELQLWTRVGMFKLKPNKGVDIRKLDRILAAAIL